MPCIWVKEALEKKRSQFKVDDVCFAASVLKFKEKLAESNGVDEHSQDLVFRGLLLQDDNTLDSYGLKDGSCVYVVYKEQLNFPEDSAVDLDMGVDDLVPVLKTAMTSSLYKNKMSSLLKNPETLENIVAIIPGLLHDPVAMTFLRDPEMLQNLIDSADLKQLITEHPALVQAASHLAADVTKDSTVASRLAGSLATEDDDEELMDIDPEMLAQAEMMAAHEEQIQNRQQQQLSSDPGPSSRAQTAQQITSSFLASALEAARANLVSTATQTASVNAPSTSASGSMSRQPHISSEYFNQAMATALGASTERNNWQSELQQLRDMGIQDEALSLRALRVTDGNVQAACDLIFEGFD